MDVPVLDLSLKKNEGDAPMLVKHILKLYMFVYPNVSAEMDQTFW